LAWARWQVIIKGWDEGHTERHPPPGDLAELGYECLRRWWRDSSRTRHCCLKWTFGLSSISDQFVFFNALTPDDHHLSPFDTDLYKFTMMQVGHQLWGRGRVLPPQRGTRAWHM
jgi:hypothetical protein